MQRIRISSFAVRVVALVLAGMLFCATAAAVVVPPGMLYACTTERVLDARLEADGRSEIVFRIEEAWTPVVVAETVVGKDGETWCGIMLDGLMGYVRVGTLAFITAKEYGMLFTGDVDGGKMVWMPVNGGEKYHARSACSGMIGPWYVPVDAAICLGFEPCGRCRPGY